MTENEKARELIATSETTVKVDPQNGWYLKRFAALQFEGSVDNFSTNMPIHVLEQQLPKDDTMKLDDAVIEGQDFDYSKFYDERGNEYSSVSELVQTLLDLDDDDSIQEYNEENPDLPYIPYEKLREMDKKDIPELLLSVADEADYVDAYKEVTDIESWNVEVTPMSNNYETMGFAFTHQGLKEYEKSIDNHIFHFCRTYAYAGEQHNRREGDFYPIMEFLHSAGEQLPGEVSDALNSLAGYATFVAKQEALIQRARFVMDITSYKLFKRSVEEARTYAFERAVDGVYSLNRLCQKYGVSSAAEDVILAVKKEAAEGNPSAAANSSAYAAFAKEVLDTYFTTN